LADTSERPAVDELAGWPAPEAQSAWFGSGEIEAELADAYRSGRMHHAWLIGGPRGIGKATLAFRLARYILAHPQPGPERGDAGLAVDEADPVFRKVASGAHPNLLVLRRPWDERAGRFKTELTVDEVRRTVGFFGSTPGEPGWRVAIVDSADEMNPSAANALLKVLEEPPRQALFLVVAHAPGRLLPTIRSRCRRLDLEPLPTDVIEAAIAGNPATASASRDDVRLAAGLAEGSLRQAIMLLDSDGAALYRDFHALVAGLPELDLVALHGFADRLARRGQDDSFTAFFDLLQGWLARRVRGEAEPAEDQPLAERLRAAPLASWAEVWEKVSRSFAATEELNLDRKQFVLTSLMTLARATRM